MNASVKIFIGILGIVVLGVVLTSNNSPSQPQSDSQQAKVSQPIQQESKEQVTKPIQEEKIAEEKKEKPEAQKKQLHQKFL